MRIFFLIAAVLSLTACDQKQKSIVSSVEPVKQALPLTSNSSSATTFFAENDVLKQNLSVTWLTPDRIDFVYLITDKKSLLERKLSGIATSLGGDLETDEDEGGVAYAVMEYWHRDGICEFAIRIDIDNRSMAQAKSGGCTQEITLDSVAILKRKDA